MTNLRRILATALLAVQLLMVGAVLAPATVSAAEGAFCQRQYGGFFGFPTWYKYLDVPFGSADCDVEFDVTEPQNWVAVGLAIFEILLRIAGMAALFMVMWGSFQYLISRGEPDKLSSALSIIINAMVGLGIALSAVGIVNLIGDRI